MFYLPMKRAAAGVLAAILLLMGATLALAAGEPKFAADAVSFSLANGLQVVVIPDHRAPVVTQMVWYRVGAADDPPGKSGIAHFLEHLMFKGTKEHPEGEFSARVEAVGGDDNAFTAEDYTAYHQTVAKQHLKLMMEFEADRMANLQITDAALLPERKVILEERGMRIDNSPSARLGVDMNAALYQNSHYRIPTIGWAHEMATLDRADAQAFYDRWYTPNNAILVVAGDVSEGEVRTLAEETYGKVARRADPPPRVRLTEPPADAARLVTLTDQRVRQPSFRRLYLAPSEHTGKPGEAEALDVLADVLGGGTTSRLYRQLVVDQGLADGIGAGYDAGPIGATSFSVGGTPRGNATVEQLSAAVDKVIGNVIDKGISADELAQAKARVRAAVVYSEDSPRGVANVVGAALATGDTLAEVQSWPDRIAAVTTADVQAVARRYLVSRDSVTGYLLPEHAEGRS
jgi:zinc protease